MMGRLKASLSRDRIFTVLGLWKAVLCPSFSLFSAETNLITDTRQVLSSVPGE
jgi:hypothetical protein